MEESVVRQVNGFDTSVALPRSLVLLVVPFALDTRFDTGALGFDIGLVTFELGEAGLGTERYQPTSIFHGRDLPAKRPTLLE